MARISLVEQYDNKDVIQQIYMLKTATDGWEERISASEQTANNALTTAEGFDARIDAVEDSNIELNTKVDGFDTRIATAQTTADTAIGNVDNLDRQVTSRIADQEVTSLDVASAGTGAYAVTAHKQNGNVTSNSFNVSKVTSATIGEGEAQNSIYLQLNLSDGTTVRTNDTVISITGVEEDIHVTSIVLEDAPDAHTIKAIFTYNNGQSISSNTLTYDYPDIASSSSPGLVMGNDATGGVQVDGQGRMTVVGWDSFATQDALEALEDEVGAVGQAGTIRNDLDIVKKLTQTGTYSGRAVNWVSARKKSNRGQEKEWNNTITVTTNNGEVIEEKTLDLSFGPPIRGMRNDEAEDLDYQAYSVPYINNLGDTLQQNIDAVDARCDNISSTVSDHGTMLNSQAEAIQANATAIAGKQDAGDYATNTALSEGLAGKVDDTQFKEMFDMGTDGELQGKSTASLYMSQDTDYDSLFIRNDFKQYNPISGYVSDSYGYSNATKLFVYNTKYESPSTTQNGPKVYSTSYIDTLMQDNKVVAFDLDAIAPTVKEFNTIEGYPYWVVYTIPTTMHVFDYEPLFMALTFNILESADNKYAPVFAINKTERTVIIYSKVNEAPIYDPILTIIQSSETMTSTSFYGFTNSLAASGAGTVVVDTAISASSTNPVQNKVISAALDMKASTATTDAITQELAGKQDKLTAGTGISIVDGVISVNLSNANGVSF